MTVELLTQKLIVVSFLVFLGLTLAAIIRMVLRVRAYHALGLEANVLLKRDIALLVSLLVAFGAPTLLRFVGWTAFSVPGLAQFVYILFLDIVVLGSLAYWVWAEYRVVGRDDK